MFQGQLVKIVTITYVACVRELCAHFPGALCAVCNRHSDFSYDIGGWAYARFMGAFCLIIIQGHM